jgi:hypothetical protein
MTYDEWNESDSLEIKLYAPVNPLARGDEGLDALLEIFEREGGILQPDKLSSKRYNYSRKRARQLLAKQSDETYRSVYLVRTAAPEMECGLSFHGGGKVGFYLSARVDPLNFFRELGEQEERAAQVVKLVRALATHCPAAYGFSHSSTDMLMGSDPHPSDSEAANRVYEAYWLNVYGREMVEEVGRERVLSVPCWYLEELPKGGVLWLTRPTPGDFDTEEARQAQARALVHLRPELKREEVLARLRERSRVFQPLEARFHPDMAPLLQLLEVQAARMGIEERHKQVERFNAWVPPEVKEWLPVEEAPPTDVEDVEAEVERYEAFHAERLIALLHKKVPAVVRESPEALPAVDDYARGHYWYVMKEKDKEELCIPLL